VIFLCALAASIARLLFFPVADYPDAEFIYPRSFLSDFLADQDYSFNLPIHVLPSSPLLSLVVGSVYDRGFTAFPSFKYWLISSLPFLLFAIFAQVYLIYLDSSQHKRVLSKLLILFVACPSSAYYLCTLHPEAWANVLALAYTVTALASVSGYIYSYSNSANYNAEPKAGISLTTLLFFALSLFSGYCLLGESQFILCLVGISWLYLSLRSNVFGLVNFPSHLLQILRSSFFLRLFSLRKLLVIFLPIAFIAGLLVFAHSLRELLLSVFSYQTSLGAALSLYREDSIYADKYPLLLRPLMTLNNLFVYTPVGFGPSAFLKILILWSILSTWFGGATETLGRISKYDSQLVSRLIFAMLYPLPIILLLPGYVNLKYYLFLVPVLLFWPALNKYKTIFVLFVALWFEFAFRSLLSSL
jgi:hypothetical protein